MKTTPIAQPGYLFILRLVIILIICFATGIQRTNAQSWNLTGNAGTSGSTNFIGTTDNTSLKVKTNNALRITVQSGGKVAIGSHTPVFKLDVKGGSITTDSLYRIAGVPVISRSASNAIQVGNATATVGIGTSTPTQKLEVAGMIYSTSGGYKFPDGSVQITAAPAVAANPQLSNLAATAVNASLLPAATATHALGSASLRWSTLAGSVLDIKTTTTAVPAIIDGASGMYMKLNENGTYRGYLGSYAGNPQDVDFGTGSSNTLGAVHLALRGIPALTVASNGSVGIGITQPAAGLHVLFNSALTDPHLRLEQDNGDYARLTFSNTTTPGYWTIAGHNDSILSNSRLNFYNSATGDVLSVTGNGNVCIGTGTPAAGYKLSVAGKVICTEMKVQAQVNWPDYVFEKDYILPSMDEVKEFIQTNHHLPGVPSAAAIELQQGVEVGAMQAILLKKVEELTLYVLQQQDEISRIKSGLQARSK